MGAGKRLCVGLWVNPDGTVFEAWRDAGGERTDQTHDLAPFLWCREEIATQWMETKGGGEVETLSGSGPLNRRLRFRSLDSYRAFGADYRGSPGVEMPKPLELTWLIEQRQRLFETGSLRDVRRLQMDIETSTGPGRTFSDPREKEDRILAIGLRVDGKNEFLVLEEETDRAERDLLKRFADRLRALDPDTIEGHNLFRFDLDYLRRRCQRFRLKPEWGRFGEDARFRNSRIRIAERTVDLPRCDIPGRTVVDTFLLVQIYDTTARALEGYGLKDVAIAFGVTNPADGDRTYIPGAAIADAWRRNRELFLDYLGDDLRETEGVADVLLPTYIAQCPNFPMTLQEILLRGTAAKVDAVFFEAYHHASHALPMPEPVERFEGGFTESYETGVFRPVYHFDVASLYPSLLLQIGRNPTGDDLGVFIPILEGLRKARLEYKQRARSAEDPDEARDYQARQASFKILINSFYGYLGFPGARFADGALAAEVTRRGRDLIQALIGELEPLGVRILEADTDGIYVCPETYDGSAPELLADLSGRLPPGIELELGGEYDAMFCYKAKNYALASDGAMIVRGSALRSRGTEPFLRDLTRHYIAEQLGLDSRSTLDRVEEIAMEIQERRLPVEALAKGEFLGQSPAAYREAVEAGRKPRRAALEAALRMDPLPKQGDRVVFYLRAGDKTEKADWQRAVPIDDYDPVERPYDIRAYLNKLRSWSRRFPSEV